MSVVGKLANLRTPEVFRLLVAKQSESAMNPAKGCVGGRPPPSEKNRKATMTMMSIDVGGASFKPTRLVISNGDGDDKDHHRHHMKNADTTATTLLVAKGKSYLSYFYVGVCSSVLYLPSGITNNEEAIQLLDNSNRNNLITMPKKWNEPRSKGQREPPVVVIALEIHYHKPVRATELRWATNKFIEANLVESPPSHIKEIANLPTNIQHHLSSFNTLYRNIKVGDRYTLEYHPEVGIRLYLNHVLLGTVGNNLREKERVDLARIIFSVWFGNKSPFSEVMKRELLTPIVPPVMAPPAKNGMPPSVDYLHHNHSHHVISSTTSSSWHTLLAYYDQHNIAVVIEFMLILLGVIVALAVWKLIKRRKASSPEATLQTLNINDNHHLAPKSYSRVQHLFDSSYSRAMAMVYLTEEEMKMLDSHGVYYLLTMYYYSLRDVVVSAT